MILAHATVLNVSLLVLFLALAVWFFLGWLEIVDVDSRTSSLAWSLCNVIGAGVILTTIVL